MAVFYQEVNSRVKQQKQNNLEKTPFGRKKQALLMLLFASIAVLSIWAVVAQSREFSLAEFGVYIREASAPWLLVAACSMLGFILFEAVALLVLCRAQGKKQTVGQSFVYAASDIYFSAITPSATGGQPASAYFMMKDGIGGMQATAILVANLCMYTLSIVVISIVSLVLRFDIFLQFSGFSQILIVCGFFLQLGLLVFFFLILKHERLLHRMCSGVLGFLCKLHILKYREEKQRALDIYMENYRAQSKMITEHPKAMFWCFVFNFLQRVSQIAVTMFVYLATAGKGLAAALDLWFRQCYVVMGANCIPVPGAMGVSDYMMLDSFRSVMTESQAVNLELLSRSISFYCCVFICGAATLIQYFRVQKRGEHK